MVVYSVLYISLHRHDDGMFYPGGDASSHKMTGNTAKQAGGCNVNIGWSGLEIGSSEYMSAFHHIVIPLVQHFNPELILVASGFDAARGDPLVT